MKIIKETITMLAASGHITLQVPDAYIGDPEPEMEEAPDEWFMYVKCEGNAHRPCVGKESGFLYLSRAGWEANKDRIKEVFEAYNEKMRREYPTHKWQTWADFEAHVEKHFDDMRKIIQRKIKTLESQAAQLKAMTI